jgi:hypothetical protein
MSLLDHLLANDRTGELHAQVAADQADLDADVMWTVWHGDRLLDTVPARYMAEASAWDNADAMDLPVSHFRIEPVAERVAA